MHQSYGYRILNNGSFGIIGLLGGHLKYVKAGGDQNASPLDLLQGTGVKAILAVTMVTRKERATLQLPYRLLESIHGTSYSVLVRESNMKGVLPLLQSEGWGLISGGEGNAFGRYKTRNIWLTYFPTRFKTTHTDHNITHIQQN